MLAERDGFGEKVVIGAFLHDIGQNKMQTIAQD